MPQPGPAGQPQAAPPGSPRPPIGRRTLRLSRQVQYVAALALVLILGVAAHQLWQERIIEINATAREMARLDMVFAEQTGRAVESVDLVLRSTIDSLHHVDPETTPRPVLVDLLNRRIGRLQQATGLLLTDSAGTILAMSDGVPEPVQPQMRALLTRHAKDPDTGLQFSEPFRLPDGSWTALMLRAYPAAQNRPGGLVAACLNLQYFEDFYKAVELTENGAILLHRRDGTVLARYPHSDDVVGRSYADLPPFRDILSHDIAGTVVMTSPLDGRKRVLAIRALKAFPLAVNVSVDEGMALAAWRRQVVVLATSVLAGGLFIVALLLLLARRTQEVELLLHDSQVARSDAENATRQLREQMEERERAEAALRQAQRIEAVGQLTGGVAHDFNNLLTVILGHLDLLGRGDRLDERGRQSLTTMRTAAERGATLTTQLLAFARRQPLVPAAVDLNATLGGMSSLLASALGGRVRAVTEFAPDLWPAMVDPTQIELVLLNLAINARDAMPAGGVLTIATANARLGPPTRPEQPPEGDYVVITVADTGTGMPPEVLAHVFEPFFTTKGPGKGSGLGLSQVFGVARQSGGGVQIDTEIGRGTSVRVFLPRAADAAVERPATPLPAAGAQAGRVSVLLVDDDAAVRDTTAQLLRTLGYHVREVSSAPAALAALRDGPRPSVLLTDVAMTEMSGPELAREVRAAWPTLPIVFISGYADPETVAGEAELRRLVRKPFRPAELAAQIEAAIGESLAAA